MNTLKQMTIGKIIYRLEENPTDNHNPYTITISKCAEPDAVNFIGQYCDCHMAELAYQITICQAKYIDNKRYEAL